MERNNRGLLIGGVILIVVVLVSAGFFIFKSGSNMTTDNFSKYSAQQIEASNAEYEVYSGDKTGKMLNTLISKLITLANKNKDNLEIIPAVTVTNQINRNKDKIEKLMTPTNNEELEKYVKTLAEMKQKIEETHGYKIELKYGDSGLINEYLISY